MPSNGDFPRINELQQHIFDDINPWSELLASVACGIGSTHVTTLQVSLAQAVFSRDMLFNIKFIADWESIRLRKQKKSIKQ